jgi:two-component system sensor histidine kinase RegB
MAAGAAHELSTPLGTIAVVAKELERDLAHTKVPDEVRDDLCVIRTELERCRVILNRMSIDSGHAIGETLADVTTEQLIQNVLKSLPAAKRVSVTWSDGARLWRLRVPEEGLAQALRALVQNALDVCPTDGLVQVGVSGNADGLEIAIRDSGPGMEAEVLRRVGEPFFTTKDPGAGMGLGIYLARSIIERLGGSLDIDSKPGSGTCVHVRLPFRDS